VQVAVKKLHVVVVAVDIWLIAPAQADVPAVTVVPLYGGGPAHAGGTHWLPQNPLFHASYFHTPLSHLKRAFLGLPAKVAAVRSVIILVALCTSAPMAVEFDWGWLLFLGVKKPVEEQI